MCRAHGEVGSREAEMNVLTFAHILAGFIIYLLNVNPEVNDDRLWIRGMFLGRFTSPTADI